MNDKMSAELPFVGLLERGLAEKKGTASIDYSVTSVAIMTLGLLLCVEVARHFIDHKAHGRPYFQTVLDGVYSELATLGIVELFVYLLLKYYPSLDKERKEVFADVHFALFFTAIFYAFQSILVAILATRNGKKQWVETEHLELDHYVEIREEFDRVEQKIIEKGISSGKDGTMMDFGLVDYIRYPRLRTRYLNLLVQVRFHQMRVHFIEGNDLPETLKVSDYLISAERAVLTQLVHVSMGAWLLLTSGLNLVYFLEDMIAYATKSVTAANKVLIWIFFGSMFGFIFFSLFLYTKMKKIFRTIINTERVNPNDSEAVENAKKDQLSLFWGSKPFIVISAIQFMSFGYALALSVIIIYWQDINKGSVSPAWYLFADLFCYAIFVQVTAEVIPQYTLCTSLGYLVNDKNLRESLARHRLGDARRKQKRKLTNYRCQNDMLVTVSDDGGTKVVSDSTSISSLNSEKNRLLGPGHVLANGHPVIRGSIDDEGSVLKPARLAELVKMGTHDLRSNLPDELQESLRDRDLRRNRRKKMNSDGSAIQMMRSFGESFSRHSEPPPQTSDGQDFMNASSKKLTPAERRQRRKSQTVSASAIIQSWRDNGSADKRGSSGLAPVSENATADQPRASDDWGVSTRSSSFDPVEDRRRRRSKTNSESAVIQSWRDATEKVAGFFGTPAPETPEPIKPKNPFPRSQTDIRKSRRSKAVSASAVIQSWRATPTAENDFFSVTEREAISDSPIIENMPTPRPEQEVDDGESDDFSIISSGSVGDLSDVDEFEKKNNLHFECLSETKREDENDDDDPNTKPPSKSIIGRLRKYYLSKTSEFSSHVFGTIICFYIIGHRIEAMIISTGVIANSENTFQLSLSAGFWFEAACHFLFIINSSLSFLFFIPSEKSTFRERTIFFASIIDLCVVGVCVTLLFVAESLRCCGDEEKFLNEYDSLYPSYADVRCCPPFGFRNYGGLGIIEPFTSLIALRILRFVVSEKILKMSHEKERRTSKHKAHEDHVGHGDGHGQTGTALELWETAMGKYPDIVAKYGEFSSELFQAMLGLDVIDEKPASATSATALAPGKVPEERKGAEESFVNVFPAQRVRLNDKQYAKLPAEAQGIIIAGQLGKPVRMTRDGNQNVAAGGRTSRTMPPSRTGMLPRMDVNNSTFGIRASGRKSLDPAPKTGPVEFEVDSERMEIEANNDHHIFVAPNARLLRSMRRCERRLLPLLSKWVTVDVVMTRFEIVYFEVIPTVTEGDDIPDTDGSIHMVAPEEDQKRQAVRFALSATKGGKGLRLCDVAAGRRVAGHLDLSEVKEIHVERDTPLQDAPLNDEASGTMADFDDGEYWTQSKNVPGSPTRKHLSRRHRWATAREDRLDIQIKRGTLQLRFYSDLETFEKNMNQANGVAADVDEIVMNIAFQWARTVARLTGRDQLDQTLPHFGDETNAELQDFLQLTMFHEKEAQAKKKKMNKRASYRRSTSGGDPRVRNPSPLRRSMRKNVSQELKTHSDEDNGSVRRLSLLSDPAHFTSGEIETARRADQPSEDIV